MSYIMLILSLVLLVVGANWLVDGSAAIARRYHISEYIIGATIVGMGTSMPELVVSVVSGLGGHPEIAIGNVVGSNIFNVFLILGVTALMMPIKYTRTNIRRDIPLNIAVSLFVMALCALSIYTRGEYGLGRVEGFLLLACFAFYLWYSLRSDAKQAVPDEEVEVDLGRYRSMAVCIASIVLGLGGLIFGGDMFVDSASAIAREWGVSEAIIGLTIVAGGTSLPELVSSVIAVSKKKGQMALGNIVGSNIFNLLLILGVSSLVQPLSMGDITFVDWGVMVLSAVMLLVASLTFKKRVLDRTDAILLLLIYAAYMAWLVMG
jgi:cation:H+ antiporter